MAEPTIHDILASTVTELRELRALSLTLTARAEAVLARTEAALARGATLAFPAPTAPPSDHRRDHRPGVPAKIDSDPELQAFIRARIDRLTFAQIAGDVAATFPPGRRVAKSAIHDWWQRTRKAEPRTPPDHTG